MKTDLIRSVPDEKLERLIKRQAIHRYGEYGDIINVIDVVLLVNIILDVNDIIECSDVNEDGIINVLDVVLLVNIIKPSLL